MNLSGAIRLFIKNRFQLESVLLAIEHFGGTIMVTGLLEILNREPHIIQRTFANISRKE